MTTVPVVLAADGGNSKTDLVIATLDGTVLARRLLPGTQPHLGYGLVGVADILTDGVRRILEDAGGDLHPVHGVFCLANVDLPDEEVETERLLRERDIADRVVVQNDVYAVLHAGTDRGWGVAVVAGAGVNALGVGPDGRVHRFLAMGDFTGDWGGGMALGTGAVGAGVRAMDGRGAPTTLGRDVALALGRVDAWDVAIGVHHGEIVERDLIGLAPLVLRSATAGDHAALALVHRLADELHDFAAAAMHSLDLTDVDVDVVLGGGVAQSGNRVLLDRFEARLSGVAPLARTVVLDTPPVTGALRNALRAAAANGGAIASARRQLALPPAVSSDSDANGPGEG